MRRRRVSVASPGTATRPAELRPIAVLVAVVTVSSSGEIQISATGTKEGINDKSNLG